MPTAHASRLMALAVLAVGCGREAPAGFAGSASCAECHAAESGAWTGSDHQRAMQVADSATVLADFSSGMLVHFGDTTRTSRVDIDPALNVTGPNGTALLVESTNLDIHSGTGGGCTWADEQAATRTGTVFVQVRHSESCP